MIQLKKDIEEHLSGNLYVTNKTNKILTLSNGNTYNRKEFNGALNMIKIIAQNSPDTLNILKEKNKVEILKCKLEEQKKEIKINLELLSNLSETYSEKANIIDRLDNIASHLEIEKKKLQNTVTIDDLTKPTMSSNRFVCGYNDNAEFMMAFYKPGFKFNQSHTEIVKQYERITNSKLLDIGGGFYHVERGNLHFTDNYNDITLFGHSDSLGYFQDMKHEILEYGKIHNVNFIIRNY